mmetsp:Transcript_5411/g.15485  ORF Transcript_5411/g.15485 Transcript_5411/m.15485 type:complete len:401 (-) Transcript_5411:195-1397(-)
MVTASCPDEAELRSPACGMKKVRSAQILGGGVDGVVEGTEMEGREVAVKHLEHKQCLMRFLELATPHGTLHVEGFSPVGSVNSGWSGPLLHDRANELATMPFASGTLSRHILVVRRGGCSFAQKLDHAGAGGAVGVILVNNEDELIEYSVRGTANPDIPVMMICTSDGQDLLALLERDADSRVTIRTEIQHHIALIQELPPHPHVVELIDVSYETSPPMIIMDLCTGGSVMGVEDDALVLVRQMLSALEHLHKHNVCHRDLKPANMLLARPRGEPGSRLVIIDFSMASRSRRMCVPCGSPRYLAPEVLSGVHSTQRDIWSVGVIAYELVLGRHPFGHSSRDTMLECVTSPHPISIPGQSHRGKEVPEAVQDLLRGLLHKDPAQRLTAAQALAHKALAQPL